MLSTLMLLLTMPIHLTPVIVAVTTTTTAITLSTTATTITIILGGVKKMS